MIFAARAGNRLLRRFGQPGVIGEIVAGLLLGPSLFGHFFPGTSAFVFGLHASAPITIIGQIGLVLLMFQIGTDFDFGHLTRPRNRNGTMGIAAASICVPFALGFGIGRLSAPFLAPHIDALTCSLFCGIGLAITAVPILGRIWASAPIIWESSPSLAASWRGTCSTMTRNSSRPGGGDDCDDRPAAAGAVVTCRLCHSGGRGGVDPPSYHRRTRWSGGR